MDDPCTCTHAHGRSHVYIACMHVHMYLYVYMYLETLHFRSREPPASFELNVFSADTGLPRGLITHQTV